MASKELARPLWYVNTTFIYVVYMFSTTRIHSIYPLPLQNSDLFKLKFKLSLPLASVVKYSMLCCQTIFPLSSIRGRKGPEPFLKRKKKGSRNQHPWNQLSIDNIILNLCLPFLSCTTIKLRLKMQSLNAFIRSQLFATPSNPFHTPFPPSS